MTEILPPRYREPERIARGGMGEIYRAEDGVLGRVVAVKVLAERYADEDSIRRRFTHEALAAARLSNAPNTVTIFDVGEHEGRPYIVMEYLPGGTLADRIEAEGAQPPGRALAWLGQTAAALDAAHAHGIVHRDVKPGNLLLDDEGDVRVADFGIASAVGLDSFTAAGTVLGTAGYLAPEQARGEQTTPASDRYALAVVAFELLTGTRPFGMDSPTAEAAAHVHGAIPSASERNPALPHEIDDVLERGLAKEPERRYAACADLVHALRDALDAAAGGTTIAAAPVPILAGRGSRNRWPLLAAAAVALALGGVALASVLGDGDSPGLTAESTPQTVRETVTVTSAPPPPTTEPETQPTTTATTGTTAPTGDAASLNDQGFELMQAGDYAGALPLLEQAVEGLSGSGSLTEAYASYNLAFTRLALGECNGVLELLDRSQAIQGERMEITRLRREAEPRCGGDGDD